MTGLMRRLLMLVMLPFVAASMAMTAQAKVVVNVDLSAQRMNVTVNGKHYATWRISSGRKGYYTPRGTWRPKWLKRMHYSRKYDNAPMPYSIFYYGGYAIHGTGAVSRLGRPASHGCIRLHPRNAAALFDLVQRHGRKNTIIRVRGSTDVAYRNLRSSTRVASRKKARRAASVRKRQVRGNRRVQRRSVRNQRRATQRRAVRRAAVKRRVAQRRAGPRFEQLQVYGAVLTR